MSKSIKLDGVPVTGYRHDAYAFVMFHEHSNQWVVYGQYRYFSDAMHAASFGRMFRPARILLMRWGRKPLVVREWN